MRSFTIITTVVLLVVLDVSYAYTSKVFKCPCAFSVWRQVDPAANSIPFDVLVHPFTSADRKPISNQTVIEKHSSRNMRVIDAVHSDSKYHFFRKMTISDKGYFRVRIFHQKGDDSSPEYNLHLHTSARQEICPVVFEQDPPLMPISGTIEETRERIVQFEQDTVRMNSAADDRIVGGLNVSDTLLPYLAAIRIPTICNDGITNCTNFCTGTLLSGRWVLTAAHCRVTVGSTVTISSRSSRAGRFTRVSKTFVHPSFQPSFLGLANMYDIAVLELEVDVEGCCSPRPQFMAINVNDKFPWRNSFARAAGYGTISDDRNVTDPMPGALRQVDVLIVGTEDCAAIYAALLPVHVISRTRHLCAGYVQDGGCSPCFGDSGGPLIQYVGNTPILMGITSFGAGCARVGAPGVFVRPSSHLDWLRSTPAVFSASTERVTQKSANCKRGQFLPPIVGQVSTCTPCPDSQFSAGGIIRKCQSCSSNLQRDTRRGSECSCRRLAGLGMKRGTCVTCRPGTSSAVGAARCVKCREGTFAPSEGSQECFPCPGAPRGSRVCN